MIPCIRSLLAGSGFALATACLAAPPLDMPPGDHPPGVPMMAAKQQTTPPWLRGVTLTESQRARIFELMHAQAPGQRAVEKELRQTVESLMKLPLTGEFDDIKAKSLADTIGRTTAEQALTRARMDSQIYRLLTPEQRKQIGDSRPSGAEPGGHRPLRGESCGELPRR